MSDQPDSETRPAAGAEATESAQDDIGGRLRAARQARGLSQRQLAARSGLTNGAVSQIEQNRISPSISSLKKLLDGMGLTLAEFFAADQPADRVFFPHDQMRRVRTGVHGPGVHGAGGQVAGLSIRLAGVAGQNALQIMHETYEPGADTGEPYQHEAEEAGVVVSGALEVTVGDQVRLLRAGDAYLFDSRQPHRFRNPGDEPCVLISAVTPPTF